MSFNCCICMSMSSNDTATQALSSFTLILLLIYSVFILNLGCDVHKSLCIPLATAAHAMQLRASQWKSHPYTFSNVVLICWHVHFPT